MFDLYVNGNINQLSIKKKEIKLMSYKYLLNYWIRVSRWNVLKTSTTMYMCIYYNVLYLSLHMKHVHIVFIINTSMYCISFSRIRKSLSTYGAYQKFCLKSWRYRLYSICIYTFNLRYKSMQVWIIIFLVFIIFKYSYNIYFRMNNMQLNNKTIIIINLFDY